MEIIIPAYNCSETIGDTLDSLVNQTNKSFTVLIIDDCSYQNIYSIIEQYLDKLNIRYIQNEQNVGCGMTRQRGIDETSADYIAFLDSDDQLLPEAVDIWMDEIQSNHPEAIYSSWLFKCQGRLIKDPLSPLGACHGKVYNVEFLRKYNIRESELIACRDDVYLNLQVFDLARNISILYDDTYVFNQNKNSVTHQKGFLLKMAKEWQMVYDLASSHIAQFQDNPLKRYEALDSKISMELFQRQNNKL